MSFLGGKRPLQSSQDGLSTKKSRTSGYQVSIDDKENMENAPVSLPSLSAVGVLKPAVRGLSVECFGSATDGSGDTEESVELMQEPVQNDHQSHCSESNADVPERGDEQFCSPSDFEQPVIEEPAPPQQQAVFCTTIPETGYMTLKDKASLLMFLLYGGSSSPCFLPPSGHLPKLKVVLDIDHTLIHSTLDFAPDPCDSEDESESMAPTTPPLPDNFFEFQFIEKRSVLMVDEYGMLCEEECHDLLRATVQKRPGLEAFLDEVCSIYDVYTYTAGSEPYGEGLCDMLDPDGTKFKGRFYRGSCVPHNGHYLKDLSCVLLAAQEEEERDTGVKSDGTAVDPLARILLVDNNTVSFLHQPANGVPIPSFYSNPDDDELTWLALLLRLLAPLPDVRPRLSELFGLELELAPLQLMAGVGGQAAAVHAAAATGFQLLGGGGGGDVAGYEETPSDQQIHDEHVSGGGGVGSTYLPPPVAPSSPVIGGEVLEARQRALQQQEVDADDVDDTPRRVVVGTTISKCGGVVDPPLLRPLVLESEDSCDSGVSGCSELTMSSSGGEVEGGGMMGDGDGGSVEEVCLAASSLSSTATSSRCSTPRAAAVENNEAVALNARRAEEILSVLLFHQQQQEAASC